MTQKQQTQFTIALLFFNLLFWPMVFFPQLKRFLTTFERDVTPSTPIVTRQKTSPEMIQRIDYENLRNIFEYAEKETASSHISREKQKPPSRYEGFASSPPPPRSSQLQLRSILTLQGRMIATLQDPMVPERMFTVVKGDIVDGYRVTEITSDTIVLEKQGQQIRLTLE